MLNPPRHRDRLGSRLGKVPGHGGTQGNPKMCQGDNDGDTLDSLLMIISSGSR